MFRSWYTYSTPSEHGCLPMQRYTPTVITTNTNTQYIRWSYWGSLSYWRGISVCGTIRPMKGTLSCSGRTSWLKNIAGRTSKPWPRPFRQCHSHSCSRVCPTLFDCIPDGTSSSTQRIVGKRLRSETWTGDQRTKTTSFTWTINYSDIIMIFPFEQNKSIQTVFLLLSNNKQSPFTLLLVASALPH